MAYNIDVFPYAKNKFFSEEYQEVIEVYEEHIHAGAEFDEDDIGLYLASLLLNNNPKTIIDRESPIYQKITHLQSLLDNILYDEDLPDELNNYTCLYLNWSSNIFEFGPYKGEPLLVVIKNDPEYVFHCIINIGYFFIDHSLFLNTNLQIQPNFFEALEHNLIKGIIYRDENHFNEPINLDNYNSPFTQNESDRDTFDALTDGQLGDWEDFDGDIDDVITWSGR